MHLTYEEAVDWLFRQLPVFQNQGSVAFKPGLERIEKLCHALGNPQLEIPVIHIGGTNGKGSLSHMLAAILQSYGLKTGLYTSPHLVDFRERIRINGEMISQTEVVDFVNRYKKMPPSDPTFFELGVAMALDHFARRKVDVAVVEVGMGGRLDATSIVKPILTAVTNIGLDHTQYLGETRPLIAAEKAAIARQGVPMIFGEPDEEVLPVFEKICSNVNAPLFIPEHTPNWKVSLGGQYQTKNLRTLGEILRRLPWNIPMEVIEKALSDVQGLTGLRGRWEVMGNKPLIIADTAHNAEGVLEVMRQLGDISAKTLRIVWGMVSDKPVAAIADLLPENAAYYLCAPNVPRGRPAEVLYGEWPHPTKTVYPSVEQAYRAALGDASAEDVVYVGGSTFVVGELLGVVGV